MKTRIGFIGACDTGKSTLINALLGRDILPQGANGYEFPTRTLTEVPWGEDCILLDTPGYDYHREALPEDAREALRCDVLVVLLSEELPEKDILPGDRDPLWDARRQQEADFLRRVLREAESRDILFVIPFDWDDWGAGAFSPEHAARIAADRFHTLTNRGRAGFFPVDALEALVASLEEDAEALARSGLPALCRALKAAPGSASPWAMRMPEMP